MDYFRCHKPDDRGCGSRDVRLFQYDEVEAATSNFHPSAFLGRGSHGSVFRATLENGRLHAAAKIISTGITTHAQLLSPSNEIEILSTIRSPRLVNLLGYTPDHPHYHIAVVELMPNGSLHDHLHLHAFPPPWPRRVRLGLQIAEAVLDLHSFFPPVIHRDIKPSNVLIDDNGDARLGDFSLAVRGGCSPASTPPPAGTMGYIDPSYVLAGDVGTKSDVYSFGVLMMEMITGRKAIDVNYSPPSVLDWAQPLIEAGEVDEIWDGRIGRPKEKHRGMMKKVAVLARRCVAARAEERPEMVEVVEKLRMADQRMSSPASASCEKIRRVLRRRTCGSRNVSDVATSFRKQIYKIFFSSLSK